MLTLLQFVLRLSCGLAAGMLFVSPRQVTSGYYRNNSYVLLGLNVLGALLAVNSASRVALWMAVGAAVFCYAAAVAWLYEQPRGGMVALGLIAAVDLAITHLALPLAEQDVAPQWLTAVDPATGALLLGSTMAAMLLGHWYLNAPGMALAPLERLIFVLGAGVILRAIVCGAGVLEFVRANGQPDAAEMLFLALRWIGGLAGTLLLAVMAYRTLKIPNTQSATGILYVAVITTFLGELASGLLSARTGYPL